MSFTIHWFLGDSVEESIFDGTQGIEGKAKSHDWIIKTKCMLYDVLILVSDGSA